MNFSEFTLSGLPLPKNEITLLMSDDGSGSITKSTLSNSDDSHTVKVAIDSVERMILHHALAGIDVRDARYIAGVKAVIEELRVFHS